MNRCHIQKDVCRSRDTNLQHPILNVAIAPSTVYVSLVQYNLVLSLLKTGAHAKTHNWQHCALFRIIVCNIVKIDI